MSSDFVLKMLAGTIMFAGLMRVDDEGKDAFQIHTSGHPPVYGEWKVNFLVNQNDYNIDILSVGFVSKYNLGNPYLVARICFSMEEALIYEFMIRALFSNEEARQGIFPFTAKTGKFLGEIRFLPGWIVIAQRHGSSFSARAPG